MVTATIVTQEFVAAAREHARNFGVPDCPLAVIGHPIANRTPDDLRRMADATWDHVLHALTGTAGGGVEA